MVGKKLILEYPLLGAGPQRFQMASMQLFPGESVHVAHNTFINFSANTGLPVGLLFLSMFWFNYKNFQYCKKNKIEKYPILDFVDKSCASALIAYFIAALFLDMIIFEAFYFILMLNLAKRFVFEKELKLAASVKNSKSERQNYSTLR
jgi:O-antigen ligase